MLEGSSQAVSRRNAINDITKKWTLNATTPTCQARWIHQYNTDSKVIRITNCFLNGSEAYSTGENSHLVHKPGQKSIAWEVIDPRVESNGDVFINGHAVKLPSKYLRL